jgi:hypothetical protein
LSCKSEKMAKRMWLRFHHATVSDAIGLHQMGNGLAPGPNLNLRAGQANHITSDVGMLNALMTRSAILRGAQSEFCCGD